MSAVICSVCETAFPCSEALKGHMEGEHGYTVCTSGASMKMQMTELQEKKRGFKEDRLFDIKMSKRESIDHSHVKYERNLNNSEKNKEGKRNEEAVSIQCETGLPSSSGDPCQAQPSRFSRDPLRGFFLQTVMECRECQQRPTKKFSTHNA